MSHLTASPFHKPSPHEFLRTIHPLSPPDTDSELGQPLQHTSVSGSNPVVFGVEFDQTASQLPAQTEPPTARFKRVSTLAYHNSGLRESRERSSQRGSKSLVVVIPPAYFSHEHGQLGHTLSSGPRSRLSHGSLMPLFPTMYGQLMAIAREFNFPSTAGLCLYLHITDNGITMTPRISDESWPFLWSHVLDGSVPASGPLGLPISGRIEFDIDLTKARWYASWIAAPHRDAAEHISLAHTPSQSHWRGDSKTSFATDQVGDEQQEIPFVQQTQTPLSSIRHIPRKLSLVDRFESFSTQSASRITSRSSALPLEPLEVQIMPTLSPIIQADEPQTAQQDLDTRVKSWRASASVAPTPLPPAGETSLDVNNVPVGPSVNNLRDTVAEDASSELNLDDFTWSVSSAGPPSDSNSPLPSDRLPSVYLDRRIEESVCLTPSACTSRGPFDYDLHSPMTDTSGLPTPDIAQRMVEDCPPTATTATSWGAPLSYPPTPQSDYRAPSIHIGNRGDFSRPVTPSTATTWGAPMSYPMSPNTPFYVHTPDAGQRAFDPYDPPLIRYDAFKATPWTHVWPYHNAFRSHTTDGCECAFDQYDHGPGPICNDAFKETPWKHVWPYCKVQPHDHHALGLTSETAQDPSASSYPHFNIYPGVYPHFDLYPAVAAAEVEGMQDKCLSTRLQAAYPVFDIYPASYPHFDVYQAPSTTIQTIRKQTVSQPLAPITRKLLVTYPNHDIYLSVYPENLDVIYASVEVEDAPSPPSVKLAVHYPQFQIYPSVYPFVIPYPSHCASGCKIDPTPDCDAGSKDPRRHQKSLSVSAEIVYPVFTIYPAAYPAFDIYPGLLDSSIAPSPVEDDILSPPQSSVSAHPAFDIYPTTVNLQMQDEFYAMSRSVHLDVVYPAFNLYPPVYPAIAIYPAVPELIEDVRSGLANPAEQNAEVPTRLDVAYPLFDLYTPVYPYFDLYNLCSKLEEDRQSLLPTRLPAKYPAFDFYPALYPYFELYPSTTPPIAPLSPLVNDFGVPAPDKAPQPEHAMRLGVARSLIPSVGRVAGVPEPASVHRSRSRSGTVSGNPPVPILGTVEPPTPPPQTSGFPSNPAVARRSLPAQSMSFVMPKGAPPGESGSVRARPSPLDKHLIPTKVNAMCRPLSMAPPSKPINDSARMDRSRSLSFRSHVPRKRDSLVLQRARAFDSSSSTHEPRESGRLRMDMLAQFPTPPLPSVTPSTVQPSA